MIKKRRLAILSLAVLTGCGLLPGGNQVPTPSPVPTPTGPVPQVQAGECPDPADTPVTGSSYKFPEGASWARVCGTSSSGTGMDPGPLPGVLLGPPDALVTNLEGLVQFANNLPKMPNDIACTMELGPAFTMVVGYPDGSTQQVTGELYGCRAFGDRMGAQAMLDDFGNRLRAQRDAYPDLAPATDNCQQPPAGFGDLFVHPTIEQTTTGRALGELTDNFQFETRPIAEWPKLRDEIIRDSAPPPPPSSAPSDTATSFGPVVTIEGLNGQCETLTIQLTADEGYWTQPGVGPMIWTLSEDAKAILAPYFEWAGQPGTP